MWVQREGSGGVKLLLLVKEQAKSEVEYRSVHARELARHGRLLKFRHPAIPATISKSESIGREGEEDEGIPVG